MCYREETESKFPLSEEESEPPQRLRSNGAAMAGLPRDVLRWLQSLDLSRQIKIPKWDLSNGCIVAEILSGYYINDISMYNYNNGESLKNKTKNWFLIKDLIHSKGLDIPNEYMDGTMHCKEGAANLLLEWMYTVLTSRHVRKIPPQTKPDYTDYPYQLTLPLHARTTATKSVKTNLRQSEIDYDPNQLLAAEKALHLVHKHIDHRRIERLNVPTRFGIKPTLAERCPRRSMKTKSMSEDLIHKDDSSGKDNDSHDGSEGKSEI